jgi:hypothetical protein
VAKSTTDSPPPRGWDLREAYLHLGPLLVPDLLAQAHLVHPIAAASEWDNPAEADRFALDLAWAGEKPIGPPRAMMIRDGAALVGDMLEAQAQAHRLEFMVHQVLVGIAAMIRAGSLRLEGVHPDHGRRFEPDFSLIENLAPLDRRRNQITLSGCRVITDLRILPPESEALERLAEELPDDPRQLALTLDTPRPDPPPPLTKEAWLIAELKVSRRALPDSVVGWHDFALEGMKACRVEPRNRHTPYGKGFSPRRLREIIRELREQDKIP